MDFLTVLMLVSFMAFGLVVVVLSIAAYLIWKDEKMVPDLASAGVPNDSHIAEEMSLICRHAVLPFCGEHTALCRSLTMSYLASESATRTRTINTITSRLMAEYATILESDELAYDAQLHWSAIHTILAPDAETLIRRFDRLFHRVDPSDRRMPALRKAYDEIRSLLATASNHTH